VAKVPDVGQSGFAIRRNSALGEVGWLGATFFVSLKEKEKIHFQLSLSSRNDGADLVYDVVKQCHKAVRMNTL